VTTIRIEELIVHSPAELADGSNALRAAIGAALEKRFAAAADGTPDIAHRVAGVVDVAVRRELGR
jgi:hypothetical protein